MNFIKNALAAVFVTSTIVWLVGCGGASSDTTPAPSEQVAGGGETTTINGRITGFGSVIVNGLHFDADAAQIMHDGVPITEDDLKVGMIISLSGSLDGDGVNGTATEIEFDEELKGPVSSVDMTNRSFVVLGQTIITDEDTAFDKFDFGTLAAGDFLEISGFFDATGSLRATLIERESPEDVSDDDMEIKGIIRELDSVGNHFSLGAQKVDYSEAEFDDVPNNTLLEGMFVEIKASGLADNGVLIAREIEYEERGRGKGNREEGHELELEGLVTALVSLTEIEVNGHTVILTADTEFEDGSAGDLTLNTKIKVEGEINAEGLLVAEEVELRRRGNLEIESTIDTVNLESNSLVVLGIEVITTATTRWEDDSEAEVRYFSLVNLNPGESLKIKGYQNAEGQIIATSIERKDADEKQEHELTGPITSIQDGALNVLGVSVVLGTDLDSEDAAELASLLSSLVVGDVITVEGTLSANNQLSALEIEVKEDDDRNEFGGDRRDGDNREKDDEEDEEVEDEDEREVSDEGAEADEDESLDN